MSTTYLQSINSRAPALNYEVLPALSGYLSFSGAHCRNDVSIHGGWHDLDVPDLL